MALLVDLPTRIAALTEGLTPVQLRSDPGKGEWSANDILSHLRACADVGGDCIAAMLDEDTPTIRAISPRAWIKQTDYPELEFRDSMQAYVAQRSALLERLGPLNEDEWLRGATVKKAGKTLHRTIFFYARWMADHERAHFKEFERIAKLMQRSEQ